jgi:hypothetical protein
MASETCIIKQVKQTADLIFRGPQTISYYTHDCFSKKRKFPLPISLTTDGIPPTVAVLMCGSSRGQKPVIQENDQPGYRIDLQREK